MFWRRHAVHDDDLSAYIDGELSAGESQRVEAHLTSCPRCREAVAELRAVSWSLSELPGVQAPRSFVVREAGVSGAPAPSAGGLLGRMTPVLSGVAAIALVAFVVLAGVVMTSDGDPSDVGRLANEPEAYDIAGDESFAEAPVPQMEAGRADDDAQEDVMIDAESEAEGTPVGIADEQDAPAGRVESMPPDGDAAVATHGTTGRRIGMAIAGAVAAVVGGAAALGWWRQRSTA